MAYDFLTVGSATLDIVVKARSLERARGAELCVPFASKTDISDLQILPGGSAANAAVALAQCRESVAVFTGVGKDILGDLVVEDLESYGVNTVYVKRVADATATALDFVSAGGEKSELIYRGATARLAPEHFSQGMVRNSRKIFVTSMASPSNYLLFRKVMAAARKYDRPLVFAPSITMLRGYARKLQNVYCDIAIMNDEEAAALTGEHGLRAMLCALPGNVNVVTAGKKGAYAFDGKQMLFVPSPNVPVKHTTGAGDCFSGVFAHAYYGHGNLGRALQHAAAAAGLKIQMMGARLGFSEQQVHRFRNHLLRKGELKVRKV